MSADEWLAGTLRNDAVLAGLVTGGVHFELAPKDTPAPYVVLAMQASTPVKNAYADKLYNRERWMVKVMDHGTSWSRAMDIAERIELLLHKKQDDSMGIVESEYLQKRRFLDPENVRNLILEFQIGTKEI